MAKSNIKIISSKNEYLEVLNRLAEQLFNARKAVLLEQNRFGIDGGINDFRAYYDEQASCIEFFYRYEHQSKKFENKLYCYASENNLNVEVCI